MTTLTNGYTQTISHTISHGISDMTSRITAVPTWTKIIVVALLAFVAYRLQHFVAPGFPPGLWRTSAGGASTASHSKAAFAGSEIACLISFAVLGYGALLGGIAVWARRLPG
jgi:hypothetical protein